MILDNYKQVYIGIADNIKKRILQHWKNSPNTMIVGTKNNSKLCIDSFKALDTTRIFVYTNEQFAINVRNANLIMEDEKNSHLIKHVSETLEDEENKMIKYFNNKYTCNRFARLIMKSFYRDF